MALGIEEEVIGWESVKAGKKVKGSSGDEGTTLRFRGTCESFVCS